MSLRDDVHLDGEGADRTMADNKRVKVVEIWENQRWFPIKGWSNALLPTDRKKFSTIDGRAGYPAMESVPAPEGWQWEDVWAIETADQWLYAIDFSGPTASWSVKKNLSSVVRRRCHVRKVWSSAGLGTAEVAATSSQALGQLQQLVGGTTLPTPSSCSSIRASDCTYRIDEQMTCFFELRFSWSLPGGGTGSGTDAPEPLSSQLNAIFFSVKRRFNDFKWLCKKFDAGKKKYPKLPAAGAGTHMLSLLGSSKSASDEHAFRATELPKWVNTVLNAPDTREDPYLKIFVAGDSELLAAIDCVESGKPAAQPYDTQLLTLCAMVARTRSMTTWLAYCFESTMLKLSTGASGSQRKLARLESLALRKGVQATRVHNTQQMRAQVSDRTQAVGQRISMHRGRTERERGRLGVQSGTEFVAGIDRAPDEAQLAADQQQGTAMRAGYGTDVALLASMEQAHFQEREMWSAAAVEVQGEVQSNRTAVHDWLLGNMIVRFPDEEDTLLQSGAMVAHLEDVQGSSTLPAVSMVVSLEQGAATPTVGVVLHNASAVPATFRLSSTKPKFPYTFLPESGQIAAGAWQLVTVSMNGKLPKEGATSKDTLEILCSRAGRDAKTVIPVTWRLPRKGQPTLEFYTGAPNLLPAERTQDANQTLATMRSKMGAVLDTQTEPIGMQAEAAQHKQETEQVFPELKALTEVERAQLIVEDAAFDEEATLRLEERRLYEAKVNAQEQPVLRVLQLQAQRLERLQIHLNENAARATRRGFHTGEVTRLKEGSASRHQPRVQRNQVRDQIYAVVSDRQRQQESRPDRIFFPPDAAAIPIPLDFANDRTYACQMAGQNQADLAAFEQAKLNLTGDLAEFSANDAVLRGSDGWYAYQTKVQSAEASGPLGFLDRDFLSRMANHAAQYEQQKSAEQNQRGVLDQAIGSEQGDVANTSVTGAIAEIQQQLEAEVPFDGDEAQRNAGINACLQAEAASRGSKEAALVNGLAQTRTSGKQQYAAVRQASQVFRAMLETEDVRCFFQIEKPSWHGGETRFDMRLEQDVDILHKLIDESNKRHGHVKREHWKTSCQRKDKINERVNRIRSKLQAAQRGKQQLSQAVSTAQSFGRPVAVALQGMVIQVSPHPHPQDAWMQAHVVNETVAQQELNQARGAASQFQSEVDGYAVESFLGNLMSFFSKGGVLVDQAGKEVQRLEQALRDEDGRIKQEERKRHEQQAKKIAHWRTDLKAGSKGIEIAGSTLQVKCKAVRPNGEVHEKSCSLNLDTFIGNNNGNFQVGGMNFSSSARNVRLAPNGVTLVCGLRKGDESWNGGQKLDLNTVVKNENGNLVRK